MHNQSIHPTPHLHPKIAFFGPPCSRKSTLIRCMGQILPDAVFVDIELVDWRSKSAERLMHSLAQERINAPVFITASMFHPQQIPEPFKVVRLIARNEERYLKEVEKRAKLNPLKADQNEQKHYRNMLKIPSDMFYQDIDPWEDSNKCDLCFTKAVLKVIRIKLPKKLPSNHCLKC